MLIVVLPDAVLCVVSQISVDYSIRECCGKIGDLVWGDITWWVLQSYIEWQLEFTDHFGKTKSNFYTLTKDKIVQSRQKRHGQDIKQLKQTNRLPADVSTQPQSNIIIHVQINKINQTHIKVPNKIKLRWNKKSRLNMLHELNFTTILHHRKIQTNGVDIPTKGDPYKDCRKWNINSWRLPVPVAKDVHLLVMEQEKILHAEIILPDNKRLQQEANKHINPIGRSWVFEQSLRQDINIHETGKFTAVIIKSIPRQDSVWDRVWVVW